jgi:hypothetical protein
MALIVVFWVGIHAAACILDYGQIYANELIL